MRYLVCIIFCSFICFFNIAYGQQIQLYVKKGSLKIGDMLIRTGEVTIIESGDVIYSNPSSLVLAKMKGSLTEIPPGQQYTFAQVKKMFSGKKTFNESFIEVALNQKHSVKKASGVVTRGNSTDPWEYAPEDLVMVLGDSMTLRAGNAPLRLLSDIYLYNTVTSDTIILSKTSLQHRIAVPARGEYYWEYKAKVLNDPRNYENCFFVPAKQEGENLLKQYKAYENSISEFSPEMRAVLMEEYCKLKGVYVK